MNENGTVFLKLSRGFDSGSYLHKPTSLPAPEITFAGAAISDKLLERGIHVAPIVNCSVVGCQYPRESVFGVPASTYQTSRYHWITFIGFISAPASLPAALRACAKHFVPESHFTNSGQYQAKMASILPLERGAMCNVLCVRP